MSQRAYDEATPDERIHFMRCNACGEWIDKRDLDEIFSHETDHKPHPDIQYSGGSAADVEEGMRLIAEKMRLQRPTLRQYLRDRAAGEARSSQEWEKAHPGCAMAAWRSGASYAYGDIERILERDGFSPEPPNDSK